MKSKILSIFFLLCGATYADIAPKSYDLKLLYNKEKIEGFVQIPKGGQFGTTSLKRPTFNEMGIDEINFPELQTQINWEKLSIYGDIKYSTFKGEATLKEDLITHSKIIPKNSSFKTKHKYIDYTLGIKYNLYSFKFTKFKPLFEYSIRDFSYKYKADILNQNNKISGKRSFGWGQANIGMDIINQLTDKYCIETTFKYGVANSKVREFYTLDIINKYNIYTDAVKDYQLTFLFGIGYKKLEFKDKQKDRQNYIVQKVKPNLIFGLEYKI